MIEEDQIRDAMEEEEKEKDRSQPSCETNVAAVLPAGSTGGGHVLICDGQ